MNARVAAAVCVVAFAIQTALGLATHRALLTNAIDLSVFDYALWSSATGAGIAYLPTHGHSLFAEHAMPTLLLLAPLSRLFQSPAYLIVVQTAFYVVAGFLLYRFARRYTSWPIAFALLLAFLFSRRSFSAVNNYFYIESAEPMLVFGMLLAWSAHRTGWYWALLILALGCKEDMALYIGAFGVLLALRESQRRLGLQTVAVAVSWLVLTMMVVLPYWRAAESLSGA